MPRFASIASTISRNPRAAPAGSGASESAEMTATPPAPAAMTAPALPASMPAIPQNGNAGARRRSAPAMRANPSRPIGDSSAASTASHKRRRCRRNRRVDRRRLGRFHAFDRQADDRVRPEQAAGIVDRHVFRPEMHAIGARSERDVDAVVHHEGHAGGASAALIARAVSIMAGYRCACRVIAPVSRRPRQHAVRGRRGRARRRGRDRRWR